MTLYKEEMKNFMDLLLKDPPKYTIKLDEEYIFTWSLDTWTTLELLTVFKKFIDGEVEYNSDFVFSENAIITIGLFRDVIRREILLNEKRTYSFIPCNGADLVIMIFLFLGIHSDFLEAERKLVSNKTEFEGFISRFFSSFMPRAKYEKFMGPFEYIRSEEDVCDCNECRWLKENF